MTRISRRGNLKGMTAERMPERVFKRSADGRRKTKKKVGWRISKRTSEDYVSVDRDERMAEYCERYTGLLRLRMMTMTKMMMLMEKQLRRRLLKKCAYREYLRGI